MTIFTPSTFVFFKINSVAIKVSIETDVSIQNIKYIETDVSMDTLFSSRFPLIINNNNFSKLVKVCMTGGLTHTLANGHSYIFGLLPE